MIVFQMFVLELSELCIYKVIYNTYLMYTIGFNNINLVYNLFLGFFIKLSILLEIISHRLVLYYLSFGGIHWIIGLTLEKIQGFH